jgi:predicted  nucleic acid-binding Zn-ribbon protein
MLYTQHMLERFFERTSRQDIITEIRRLEDRIKRLQKDPDSPKRARMLQSLQGNLDTCKSRLANLDKAQENYDLLQAEAENLEAKIQSVTEMAINRSDAGAITGQVEEITQGLVRTEQTINELGFATAPEVLDLSVPQILARDEAPAEGAEAEPPVSRERRQDEIQFF